MVKPLVIKAFFAFHTLVVEDSIMSKNRVRAKQGVWREGVETNGVERESLDARTWALARKIRAEVRLRNKMADEAVA